MIEIAMAGEYSLNEVVEKQAEYLQITSEVGKDRLYEEVGNFLMDNYPGYKMGRVVAWVYR